MGIPESKNNQFKWVDRYELIDIDNNDKILKLMSRASEEECIGKEYCCQGAECIQQMELLIDKKVLAPCPHLMRLLRVAERRDSYCGQNKVFYLVFQKPFQTLKEESLNRRFKHKAFDEEQIDIVLQSCVKALLYLKKLNQNHLRITSSSIFINEDRTIVLGDPWLFIGGNQMNSNINGYCYPSPEKILYDNGLIQSYDGYLSDLFTLGVVLLQILYMQHMDILYERGYRRVLDIKIIERLAALKNDSLKKHLRIILSHQSNYRGQIYKMFDKQEDSRERFIDQEIQMFKRHYIRSNMEVSDVKTIKPSKQNESQSIINGVSVTRNPMQISTATLPDCRHHLQVFPNPMGIQNSATTVRWNQKDNLNRIKHAPRYILPFTQNSRSMPYVQGPAVFNNAINISYANEGMRNKVIIGQNLSKEVDLAKDENMSKISMSSIHKESPRESDDINHYFMPEADKKTQLEHQKKLNTIDTLIKETQTVHADSGSKNYRILQAIEYVISSNDQICENKTSNDFKSIR